MATSLLWICMKSGCVYLEIEKQTPKAKKRVIIKYNKNKMLLFWASFSFYLPLMSSFSILYSLFNSWFSFYHTVRHSDIVYCLILLLESSFYVTFSQIVYFGNRCVFIWRYISLPFCMRVQNLNPSTRKMDCNHFSWLCFLVTRVYMTRLIRFVITFRVRNMIYI